MAGVGRKVVAAAVAAVSFSGLALGASKTWVGPAGGSWSNPANWSPMGVPMGGSGSLGDNAIFEPGGNSTFTFDGSYDPTLPLHSLQFGTVGGGAPTLLQSGGTLAVGTENFDAGTYGQSGGLNSVS